MELTGQIFGIVAVIISFILYQIKGAGKILIVHTLLCFVMVLHYGFLGAVSGMVLNLIGVVRNVVYYRFTGKYAPVIMSVIMGIAGICSWNSPWSVLIIVGLIINSYAMSFKNPQHLRLSLLATCPLVFAYNCAMLAIGGMVMETASFISAILGLVRYRTKS